MSIVDDGFRQLGAPSEFSLKSKAQIDALFEDTKSVCSSTFGGWYTEVNPPTTGFANLEKVGADEQKRVNSAVQARIEAMFASVEAETGIPGECAAAIIPVRYLGAAPVGNRVASIRGLQEPLQDLLGTNSMILEQCLPADLEISRRGLTFRTSKALEKTNPFRRISVWSALRLRSKILPCGKIHHAFLPLVGDDASSPCSDDKHADLYRTMKGFKKEAMASPPIFAVVMRRPGAVRLLECHAFVCQIEEDAVAAAATLYRALLADLDANHRKPRQANGVGCVSLASVASVTSSVSVRETGSMGENILGAPPPRPLAPHPVRPPRIKKSASSSSRDDGASGFSDLESALRRNGQIEEFKEEDILEGRSRRSSVALSAALPLIQNIDSAPLQDKISQNVLQEDNKNNSQRKKTSLSSRCSQQKLRNKDKRCQYDIFHEVSQNDANFSMEAQTILHSENNYEKIPLKRNNTLNKTRRQTENITYHIRDHGNTGKSNKSNQMSIVNDECIVRTHEEPYNLSVTAESTDVARKIECRNNISSGKISLQIHGQNCNQENEPNNCNLNESRRKGHMELCDEDFQDVNKICNLPENNCPKVQQVDSENVLYKACDNKDPRNRRIGNKLVPNPSLREPTNAASFLNTAEYSQPRPRRDKKAGSEPPRIGGSERSPFSAMEHESHLKKVQSDLDLDGGDLLTRVELPRRGSFFNSSSSRQRDQFQRGTPLGFTELFDEFRNQEGLTSVDDILAAIIDPEGMSFNDLKPLYKEFLLKLAATLTRDELYERSASIMRKRRRPQRARASRRPGLLGRAIKGSVSRLKGGPTDFTSVICPATKLNDSLGSSSSCDAKNKRNRVLASRLGRKRSSRRCTMTSIGQTTSEDSDTCRRIGKGVAANRSSSGYVSCSECSYDSESCTCISADKCYCSLSRRVSASELPIATVMCSCDTDSCSESNKCYCARKLPVRQPTILEQLRQRGIVPSESTLSRTGSPQVIRTLRTNKNSASSRSLEYLTVQPRASSSDNLALDYELFSSGRNPRSNSSDSDKVLVVGARDSQGRLIYVSGTGKDPQTPASIGGRSRTHYEALSIKKSAEIAAVFRNSPRKGRRASYASSLRSSASVEAGLGYLP